MKKILVALVAIAVLGACSSEKKDFAYRGLSMSLPFQTFIDSLQQRGFFIDSAKTDSDFQMVVMGSDAVRYRLVIAQKTGQVAALQENWELHSNDSTRNLWQQMRDDLPNMPKHGDDHKIAKFEAEGGFITLTLENTYKPTLSVRYDKK